MDLRTLSSQEVQAQILDFTLQDGPVELQAASFGATGARTESFAIKTEIQEKILRLAFASICQTMFTELCPGYSIQPHAALDHIRQVHTDRDGNPVSSSVQAYHQQLMSTSRPFLSRREYSRCPIPQRGAPEEGAAGDAASRADRGGRLLDDYEGLT